MPVPSMLFLGHIMFVTAQDARKLVAAWVSHGRPRSACVEADTGDFETDSEVAWALLVGLATAGPMPCDQEVKGG